MLVCPRENFNKECIVVETMDGHQCVISHDDVRRANLCDMYGYATIHLKPESRVAELLGTQAIKTWDKAAFSEFYLGSNVTQPCEVTLGQAEWCDAFIDNTLFEKRHGKTHPHPLPPFPR